MTKRVKREVLNDTNHTLRLLRKIFSSREKNREIMQYQIEEIEGIGTTYGKKLREHGVVHVADLLAKAGTRSGRAQLHKLTHIPESLILTWVNHADLMRIDGIGSQTSELLEASGVDSVKELSHRNAANLYEKMKEVNSKLGLSGKVPSAADIQKMIDAAKKMEPGVSH